MLAINTTLFADQNYGYDVIECHRLEHLAYNDAFFLNKSAFFLNKLQELSPSLHP